ncbi:MAG: STM4012 family radical SAM protein [Deltaproteobacteria bacterium]|nr:STM4012 family radical SAM protein [Deltaproteobacteria bacterium]
MNPLDDASRYQHYVYAYPHKTAYRRIEPALDLAELWARERRDHLFVYLHVPFCEIRCGFCNLFTQPVPEADRVEAYLGTLARQVAVVRRALDAGGVFAFSRAAIGGGTPTLLDAGQLERAIDLVRAVGAPRGIPMSVETSPETALPDRLAVAVQHGGADRISIGVQSFVDDECRAVNRPQRVDDIHRALRAIRDAGPATLNVDLMYGLPGQTAASWRASLAAALAYRPEELYLYPLYVRPLTTLGRKGARAGVHPDDAARVELYEQGREQLLEAGYRQVSMRMFRLAAAGAGAGASYCCQEDGMIGLGCGARSYTRAVHYSSEWAVGARGVREIIDRWIAKPDDAFAVADYGFVLDDDEQRRRWLILSLLSDEGLDVDAYRARFAADPVDDPALAQLAALTTRDGGSLRLTAEGLARADAVGPALFSEQVRRRMAEYELS